MHRTLEEILEAAWKADESGELSLARMREACPIAIEDADMELLEKRDLLTRGGGRLALTRDGRTVARSVVRRHRLAETLFASILDLDVDKREQLACEMEHALLPEVEESICILLGHPSVCPDNKPIPPGTCCSARRRITSSLVTRLASLEVGDAGRISYIKTTVPDRLERLTSLGLTPGTLVRVFQRSPAFCVELDGCEVALNRDAAEDIFVTRVGASQVAQAG